MVNKKKKYRIVQSFVYKGPDGNWKRDQHVTIGPGEEMPKVNAQEAERLLSEQRICEVDLYGENVPNKRFTYMNNEEIDRTLSGKDEIAIIRIINSANFDHDTLSRIMVYCEKNRFTKAAQEADNKLVAL